MAEESPGGAYLKAETERETEREKEGDIDKDEGKEKEKDKDKPFASHRYIAFAVLIPHSERRRIPESFAERLHDYIRCVYGLESVGVVSLGSLTLLSLWRRLPEALEGR